jgi:hypothetical protein
MLLDVGRSFRRPTSSASAIPSPASNSNEETMAVDNIIELARARDPKWLTDCLLNSKGKPLAILANVLTAMRADPRLKDCFAYD